jgi:hypothetical protein
MMSGSGRYARDRDRNSNSNNGAENEKEKEKERDGHRDGGLISASADSVMRKTKAAKGTQTV